MTTGSKLFPLNFDEPYWAIEDALRWVFLGSFDVPVSTLIVKYLVNEDEGRSLKPLVGNGYGYVEKLQKFLIVQLFRGSIPNRMDKFSPLVWCRLAVQFWMEYGGSQSAFTSAMTQWVKYKNRGGVAFISYRYNENTKRRKIPLEAFLFGGSELPDLIQTEWLYKYRSDAQLPKAILKTPSSRSDENQVGTNLLGAVKNAIAELVRGKRGKSFPFRKPDPETGKYRYKGLRGELYDELYQISPEFSEGQQLKDGRIRKPYAKSAVLKAISKVAICRRSWA